LDVDTLKQAFAEDAYLVFRDVVSKEQLAALRGRIADEFDRSRQSGRPS
jgi:ectoine hydroxylase-related dioxygenase (phytanoyl-CoA dioxygenase family)